MYLSYSNKIFKLLINIKFYQIKNSHTFILLDIDTYNKNLLFMKNIENFVTLQN